METDPAAIGEQPEAEAPLDLRRYLALLVERKWWILGVVAAALLLATVRNETQTPMYEAQARLLVDAESYYGSRRSSDNVLDVVAGLERLRTVDTQLQIIKSRSRLEGAARLVAAQQIVAAGGPAATSGSEEVAEEAGVPEPNPVFADLPPELSSELVPPVTTLRQGDLLSPQEAAMLLIHHAQLGETRSDTYPPGIEEIQTKAARRLDDDETAQLSNLARRWVPVVAEQCQASASAQSVQDTDVVAIVSRSPTPQLAAAYANAVAQEHIWRSLIKNREAAKRGADWIDKREEVAQQELTRKEQELAAVLEASGLASVPDAAATYATRVQTLTATVETLRGQVGADEAEIGGLDEQLAAQQDTTVRTTTTSPNPALQRLRDKLIELEGERATLLEKVTEAHPSVTALDGQIREVTRQVEQEVDSSITAETKLQNPLGQQLLGQLTQAQVRLVADQAQLAAGEAALARAHGDLARVPAAEQQAALLQRDVEVAEKNYLELLDQRRQLELVQASEMAGASILDHARVPAGDVSPNKRLNYIMALLVGLIGGLALAFLVDHLDNTIRDPEELERRFGLVLLAIVPKMRHKDIGDSLVLGSSGTPQGIKEALYGLRSNLRYANPDVPLSCILVTSPGMGEGKTTVAINLAIVLGELSQRVVLVDTDLRRPAVARAFGLPNEMGVTSCAIGQVSPGEVLQTTKYESVRVIASGPLPPNPPQLLESQSTVRFMQEVRQSSDLVVLDSPPAAVLTDAQALASLADGILLVVEANKTRRPPLARALELLRRTNTPILGVVVNKAVARRGSYGYYYYSGYYSGYYNEDAADTAAEPS